MTCYKAHHSLPRSRRVSRLDVVADYAGVACGCVSTFPKIFEEDPHKLCADCQANQCQPVCGVECAPRSYRLILHWTCVCCHRKPLPTNSTCALGDRNLKRLCLSKLGGCNNGPRFVRGGETGSLKTLRGRIRSSSR